MNFDFDTLPEHDGQVIQKHSRSFTLASRFLPKAIREDVVKLYAWCRWCDDAVDAAPNKHVAARRLAMLQQDVQRIYNGQEPHHPASRWLAELVVQYGIPAEYPLELLRGMETDLQDPVLETVDELMLYCYRSAGTVGLMMCRIMGVEDRHALRHAESLGIAMQLTNIVRDISEDWDRGRRYVPQQWLRLVPGKDVKPVNRQVQTAAIEMLALAESNYQQGLAGLKYLPPTVRFAIRVAGVVYREIGEQIRREKYRIMDQRISVPLSHKVRLLAGQRASGDRPGAARIANRSSSTRLKRPVRTPFHNNGSFSMNHDTMHSFFVGVSLTFVMGATLFVLVGLNPKEQVYQSLPWIYAASCGLIAAFSGLSARRVGRQLELQSSRSGKN